AVCMRYTQGGGLTAEGRRRRKQVRLEAAGRFRQGGAGRGDRRRSPPGTTWTAFALVAEADGNRTRRRRETPSTGFEDRGGHQPPGRPRAGGHPRRGGARQTVMGRAPAPVTKGHSDSAYI